MKLILKLSLLNFFVILTFVLKGLYLGQKSTKSIPSSNSSLSVNNSTPSVTGQTQPTTNPLFQLSQHNSASDCWVSFNNNVYDVTTYINLHPGGPESIIKYCGRDITTSFNTRDQTPPKPHSQTALNILFSLMVKK